KPQPRLMAHFRPQAWVGDNATDIDDGHADFDATEKFLSLSLEEITGFEENNYDSDHLSIGLPEREAHNGPFEVDTNIDEWLEENGIEDRSAMTQEQLDQLRTKYSVTVES